MIKISKDDLVDSMTGMVTMICDIGSEKARETGEPVDGLKAYIDYLAEEGFELNSACFICDLRVKFIVDEDGNLLIPEENEAQ